MFQDKGSPCKLFDLDVENLKVVEIKRRLKELGLPVTGNKSELVERLQKAMISGADTSTESSNQETAVLPDSAEDSPAKELNDEILEENVSSPMKEKDSSQETQDQTVSSAAASVPLKKRALIQPEADDEAVKPKKRFVLNRNNVPTPSLFAESSKGKSIEMYKQKSEAATRMETEDETLAKSGSVKKFVSLTTEIKKELSEADKVKMRAQRFNIPIEPTKSQSTLDPAKRKQILQWKSNVAAATPSSAPVPNMEILKKRAERFGENVSDVLKKLEDQEKLNKRKSKFGITIGDSKTSGPTGSNKASASDEQEKKQKRAARFGKELM